MSPAATRLARLPLQSYGANGGWMKVETEFRRIAAEPVHNHETRIAMLTAIRGLWRTACLVGRQEEALDLIPSGGWMPGPGQEWEQGSGYVLQNPEPSLWLIAQAETTEAWANGMLRKREFVTDVVSISTDWRRDDGGIYIEAWCAEPCEATTYGGGFYCGREFVIPEADRTAGGPRAVAWLRAAMKSVRIELLAEMREWSLIQ